MLILGRPSQLSSYVRIYSMALLSLGISSNQEENPAGVIAAVAELKGLPKFPSTGGLQEGEVSLCDGEICKFELVLAFSFWQSAALALS